MNYSFDTDHAIQFGVEEAIVLQNIVFWIAKNKANGINEHSGRTWTYSSASAFAKLFPFWNQRKISRILASLEKQGAIQSGNFNKVAYDRTKWYSLVDESSFVKIDTWKNVNCPMDSLDSSNRISDLSNGSTESVQPIPDKNTNRNTDKSKSAKNRANSLVEVEDYCESLGLPRMDGEACWEKWNGNGWRNGVNAIKDWKATIRSWKAQGYMPSQKNYKPNQGTSTKVAVGAAPIV